MRRSAIRNLNLRLARLEAKYLKLKGIKGFFNFIQMKINQVEGDRTSDPTCQRLMTLRGVFSSKVDKERKTIKFSSRMIAESIKSVSELLEMYERSLVSVKAQSKMHSQETGTEQSQTTLVSPLKEAELMYPELIRRPKEDFEKVREHLEEALKILESIV